MNERCKYHVCDEEDDHSPECTDWQQAHRNLDGEDAPYPGMATAFEAVENIRSGVASRENIWNVNTEQSYHEKKTL